MPSTADLNPEDIRDLWDNCLLIHATGLEGEEYNYTYIGEAITALCGADGEGNGALTQGYAKVAQTGKPLMEEGEFMNSHQHIVRWRQCLVPLGEDGQVQAILGGIRFRVFHPQ